MKGVSDLNGEERFWQSSYFFLEAAMNIGKTLFAQLRDLLP